MKKPHAVLKDEATQLLLNWKDGDQTARDELLDLIYDDLCLLARTYKRGLNRDNLFSTGSLVHETFLRLMDPEKIRAQNKSQFFALAAKAMQRLVLDKYRAEKSDKRGGDWRREDFDKALAVAQERDLDLEALNDALNTLETLAPRQCSVVRMRFFLGFSEVEAADLLQLSPDTVLRDWKMAKAWLMGELAKKQRDVS